MHKLTASSLPIYLSNDTYELSFNNGLEFDSSGFKTAAQIKELLANPELVSSSEPAYRFYRDINFEKDRSLFRKYDLRYDITVIFPGDMGGECKKTSGHYHGYIADQPYTYPEIYEVLEGRALYILQKAPKFDPCQEPALTDIKAVLVEKGQSIIIPPFYGHCSINIGNGPLVFSNLAVVSCPLHYEPIQLTHGLSYYTMKDSSGKISLSKNPSYHNLLSCSIITPEEAPDMGIRFHHSIYRAFTESPEKFAYMLHPEKHLKTIESLINNRKGEQVI